METLRSVLPPVLTVEEKEFASKLKMVEVLNVLGRIVGITIEMGRITILYDDSTSVSLLLTIRTYYYFTHLVRSLPDNLILS